MKTFTQLEDANGYPCLPNLQDLKRKNKISMLTRGLILDKDAIEKIMKVFNNEMKLGLSKNPTAKSSLQMENTFIPELPDGTENGYFMALDLGGTHCRVLLVHLKDGLQEEPLVQYYDVPENIRLGPGTQLFDFLAAKIHNFMERNDLLHLHLPLGFTFSFPMVQKALDVGVLVTWTKSFNCSGVVGNDAVKMLNEAIARRKDLHVNVVAILNDTTGTLVQGAYLNSKCGIGLILGTGSNACYMEKSANVEKWSDNKNVSQVIIDCEWGAFGDNGVLDFIKTDFDRQVDANSLLVNSFTFEKYFSGQYMGEVVRVILVKLIDEGHLFEGKKPIKLMKKQSFITAYISQIESDKEDTYNTKAVLKEFDILDEASEEDIQIIRYICSIISVRAALLISVCIASLLIHMDRQETVIAVDGSLFKYHPKLPSLMNKHIEALAKEHKFKLILAEDGSGKGAGLIAAIATRLTKSKSSNGSSHD
ncbi:hypothetical protein CHUAL_007478 [Chamberlinius hualienensis]